MITGFLLLLVSFLLNLFSILLPSWSLSPVFYSSLGSFLQAGLGWNNLFPVWHVIFILSLILGFEIIVMLVRMGSGLLSLFRGGGGVDL